MDVADGLGAAIGDQLVVDKKHIEVGRLAEESGVVDGKLGLCGVDGKLQLEFALFQEVIGIYWSVGGDAVGPHFVAEVQTGLTAFLGHEGGVFGAVFVAEVRLGRKWVHFVPNAVVDGMRQPFLGLCLGDFGHDILLPASEKHQSGIVYGALRGIKVIGDGTFVAVGVANVWNVTVVSRKLHTGSLGGGYGSQFGVGIIMQHLADLLGTVCRKACVDFRVERLHAEGPTPPLCHTDDFAYAFGEVEAYREQKHSIGAFLPIGMVDGDENATPVVVCVKHQADVVHFAFETDGCHAEIAFEEVGAEGLAVFEGYGDGTAITSEDLLAADGDITHRAILVDADREVTRVERIGVDAPDVFQILGLGE